MHNAKDSLSVLYHLYDLSSSNDQRTWGWQIYETAKRANNLNAQIDVLRQLSVRYSQEDSMLYKMEMLAEQLPESDEQKECLTFIRLQRETNRMRTLPEEEEHKEMMQLFDWEQSGGKRDIYDNILHLYMLCIYLSEATTGTMYMEYLNQLGELLDQLPENLYALRNNFYTRSAIAYTYNGEHKKAIEADNELLEIIKELERRYSAMGRRYRNYATNYYISYRRMLSNYPGLTAKEVEIIYRKILALCGKSEEIKFDFENRPRTKAYYLLKMKRYAEAIPCIKKALENETSLPYRRQLLSMLKEAATATGDSNTLLSTLKEYNDILETAISHSTAEYYQEVQIRYDVSALKMKNAELEVQKRQAEVKSNHLILTITLTAFGIVLAMLGAVCWLYYRSQKLANHLKQFSNELSKERNELKLTQTELIEACERAENANRAKSEFLHSMSHEVRTPLNAIMGFSQLIVKKVPAEARQKLDQFARIITLNTDYLTTLINDILDVSAIESGEMLIEPQPSSVHAMGYMAVENMKGRVNPSVVMEFVKPPKDFLISTDRQRVEQVLVNLLGNATKFTEAGSITLAYNVDHENNELTFSITDTGKGIPEGQEEVIFDRFVKLDPFSQGSGLGLYLCQNIARMLGGRIYVDTEYKSGARFCFVIPIK